MLRSMVGRHSKLILPCLSLGVFTHTVAGTSSWRSSLHSKHLFFRGGSTAREPKNTSFPNHTSTHNSTLVLGGGAINEKERRLDMVSSSTITTGASSSSQYDPCNVRSHLWHALEGLDRYPNYLNRWSTDDMGQLEAALEAQLKKVREQRAAVLERRLGIDQLVNQVVHQNKRWQSLLLPPQTWEEVKASILDPKAVKTIFESMQFKASRQESPILKDVLEGRVYVELDPSLLEEIMDQELFDVYSIPVLSQEFCHRLKEFVKEVTAIANTDEFSHLNLGRRPVDLDTIGLGWVNDLLLHLVMRPIARHLYKERETYDDLDWRQGYIAGYSSDPSSKTGTTRHRLVPHTDDSEVTMNLCIGDEFQGGALQFWGLRGTRDADNGQMIGDFQPQLGTALLHAGRHLHEVTQVTTGDRYAYIIWARSWRGSRAQTCPCCWLNRREGNSCICGARWN